MKALVKVSTVVVGSRRVVSRDVKPYEIVGGLPAGPICLRFPQPINSCRCANGNTTCAAWKWRFADIHGN